ncbi:non-ribosomal peptide synthetase [Microcoleus sp. F4-D5]|uniref:non-ribosomal peptide synthetase n=1 Tax=Microcoleus sp. F4-D5 TaxID=2818760 RepID=UPI002FD130E4
MARVDQQRSISTIDNSSNALSSHEYDRLLTKLNNTEAEYAIDKCVHELFELQVERAPESTAVVFGNQRLTYLQLNEQANKLARYLRQIGVSLDMPVGLFTHRSVEMVIGLLGILKAGGAYVPYDPTYPKARLATMFQEVPIGILLTQESLINHLPDRQAKIVCLDTDRELFTKGDPENLTGENPTPENLAYVVFTSGSTGKPKATAVFNRGWNNLLNWFTQEFQISPHDKVLIMSSFSFDITQRSLMMPLVSGGELHLLASDYFDQTLILDTISTSQITLLNCAPSPFYALTETQDRETLKQLSSLRKIFLGGEAISASRLQNSVSCEYFTAELVNVYGVSECSDVSTFYRLHDFERYALSSVPIGKPIFNTKVYVVDDNLTPVPIGEVGELCIAGDGVGKGYLNDQGLTQRKFIPNPFSSKPNAKLYKTGDLVRYRSDGNLEFIGRLDHQVKIRGLRIELGEIETSLRQHAEVQEAVVLVEESSPGDQRLVAYLALSESRAGTETGDNEILDTLRQHLISKIPQYMVPNKFVLLNEMPLNPNGKVDRTALQNMPTPTETTIPQKPRTPLAIAIGAFFAEALRVEKVDLDKDFFELGGHSLLAAQVLLQIKEAFGVHFDLSAFSSAEGTTAASLAERVVEARGQS